MNSRIETTSTSKKIRGLARQVLRRGNVTETVRAYSTSALHRPVVYMRCAEFHAILKGLTLKPGMRVLDISSPQWFSLLLASEHPEVRFTYSNIMESETGPFKDICQELQLKNLVYMNEDVRALPFGGQSFDRVVSISVLEHVYPAHGGDFQALREIRRVLKDGGELHLTLPFKDKQNLVYVDGPVYERGAQQQNFFAREYDRGSFRRLVKGSGFRARGVQYITERRGLMSIDYHEWGPGRGTRLAMAALKLKGLIEKAFRRDMEALLARHYLRVSPRISARLVNIAAVLEKRD